MPPTDIIKWVPSLAHEINNQLTIVQGKTHQIRNLLKQFNGPAGGDSPSEFTQNLIGQAIEAIEKTSFKIAATTRIIGTYSRDNSQFPPELVKLDVLFQELMNLCGPRLRSSQIEIKIGNYDPDLQVDCQRTEVVSALAEAFSDLACVRQINLEVRVDSANVQITVGGLANKFELGLPKSTKSP